MKITFVPIMTSYQWSFTRQISVLKLFSFEFPYFQLTQNAHPSLCHHTFCCCILLLSHSPSKLSPTWYRAHKTTIACHIWSAQVVNATTDLCKIIKQSQWAFLLVIGWCSPAVPPSGLQNYLFAGQSHHLFLAFLNSLL